MFFSLIYPLKDLFGDDLSFLRVIGYVSFRTVFAALTSLLLTYFLGPKFIRFLQSIKFKEEIRHDGPKSHQSKAGTPTMGGLIIFTCMLFSALLWGNLENTYVIAILVCTILLSAVGFWDDYQKTVLKVASGMQPKVKLILQIIIALAFSIYVYQFPYNRPGHDSIVSDLFLPFIKEPLLNLGILIIPFWMLIIVGTSNAVNLTDGLDGLATGISAISLATLAIIAYVTGIRPIADYLLIPFIPEANEITVILGALLGSCIGFLWYNNYPAQVFMGDTGSLALGGIIGMVAICLKREVLLIVLGGVFVAEAVSVILQVGYYKMSGKRIFRMAPLHHHFELKGWHENKVVTRFWIVGILLALISLSSLKII